MSVRTLLLLVGVILILSTMDLSQFLPDLLPW